MTEQAIIAILEDIRDGQKSQDTRIDRLERAVERMVVGIEELTKATIKLEETNKALQRQQDKQEQTDELQNQSITALKDELHEIDKRISSLEGVPAKLLKIEEKLGTISHFQAKDEIKWVWNDKMMQWIVPIILGGSALSGVAYLVAGK